MKKLTLAVMAIALGVLLTQPAFAAFGKAGCQGNGQGYFQNAACDKLNLSAEQKTKIEALRTAHEKEIRPVREKMFDKSVELRRLWQQANPDKDKITAVQKELNELRTAKQNQVTAKRLEIRNVLTPEQKEKLSTFGGGRGDGLGQGRGMKGQRGGMRGQGGGFGMGVCR